MTKGKREISKLTAEVKKHGNGAHVIVPKEWIGVEVEVIPLRTQIAEEQPRQPAIKTKEELKSEYSKFNRHTKAAARLARRNIDYSPKQQ